MSDILSSIGFNLYRLGFELSPIILQDGVAANIPGNLLPIISITQASTLAMGLLGGQIALFPNDYFAHFRPLPGGELIKNQVGEYPSASQVVAANSIIAEPLRVSMLMEIPVNQVAGHISKFITMSALKGVLDYHNQLGGTYIVSTPSYIYFGCILIALVDASSADQQQVQSAWRWDFKKPLITASQVQATQNNAMQKATNGGIISSPSWSGLGSSIAPTLFPQLQSLIGGLS